METRISYKDFFNLGKGSEFTHVICTSMSMDYSEQLKIIACALGIDEFTLDYVPILNEKRKKFYFFHDKNKTSQIVEKGDLKNQWDVIRILHDMRKPVKMDKCGVFHPKIVLMRYTDSSEEPHYRVLISSRNITITDSEVFETGVILDGKKIENNEQINHNLCSLLKDPVFDEDVIKELSDVIKELSEYNFTMKDGKAENVYIKVSGINGANGTIEKQEKDLLKIWQMEMESDKKSLCILSPDYETIQDQIEKHNIYAPVDNNRNEIYTHAKLYYYPEEKTVWIGSCNSSDAAMKGTNIECMVKIKEIEEEEISFSNGVFDVFGFKCKMVSESKFSSEKTYKHIGLLNKFIECCIFKGSSVTDKRGLLTTTTIDICNGCSKDYYDTLNEEDIELKCLPYGMSETTTEDKTKWKIYNKDYNLYIFKGDSIYKDSGILRIGLFKKGETKNPIAEQYVVFDDKLRKAALSGENMISYDRFVNTDWIDRLMETYYPYEVNEEYDLFKQNYEIVVKKLDRDDPKRNYLEELKDLYEFLKSKED